MQTFLFWLQAFASSIKNPLLCRLLTSAQSPHALLHEALPPIVDANVGQISPGKSMILPCTPRALCHFVRAHNCRIYHPHVLQTGFVMLCSLTQGFGLICDFCSSAHRFALRLPSHGRSPFRTCLRLVLFKVDLSSPFWNMYRGLSPHKIMPMPGTHKNIKSFVALTGMLRSFLATHPLCWR